jgi:hypothetical protein
MSKHDRQGQHIYGTVHQKERKQLAEDRAVRPDRIVSSNGMRATLTEMERPESPKTDLEATTRDGLHHAMGAGFPDAPATLKLPGDARVSLGFPAPKLDRMSSELRVGAIARTR